MKDPKNKGKSVWDKYERERDKQRQKDLHNPYENLIWDNDTEPYDDFGEDPDITDLYDKNH